MPAQWTGEIIGQLHLNGITAKRLAKAVGWSDKYLSLVLNGHREPKNAEAKVRTALDSILTSHPHDTTEADQ